MGADKILLVCCVFFLICIANPTMAEQSIKDCEAALVRQNIYQQLSSHQAQLAWLRLVNSDNYEESKTNAGASLSDWFSGDYARFDQLRNQYLSQEKYNLSEKDSLQIMVISTPVQAYSNYIQCVRLVVQGRYGLSAWLEDVDNIGATMYLHWSPPPPITGSLENVVAVLSGATSSTLLSTTSLTPGEHPFNLARIGDTVPIRATVNGDVMVAGAAGGYGDAVYSPATAADPPIDTKLCVIVFNSDDQDPHNKMEVLAPNSQQNDCAILSSRAGGTDARIGCQNSQNQNRWGPARFAVKMPSHGEGEGLRDPLLTGFWPQSGNCGWN